MPDWKHEWMTQFLFPRQNRVPTLGTSDYREFRQRIEEKAAKSGWPGKFSPLAPVPAAGVALGNIHKNPQELKDLRSLLQILPHANSRDEAILYLASEWYRLRGAHQPRLLYVGQILTAQGASWNITDYKVFWGKVKKAMTRHFPYCNCH